MGEIIALDGKHPGKDVGEKIEKKKPKTNIHTNFFGLPLEILRSKMFLDFIGTPEARVYFLLYSYIRRGRTKDYGGVLYKKFYEEQRKLVSRWDQDDIAKMLGLKNRASISKYTTRLEEKWKFIKIHKFKSHKDTMNVYELGYLKEIVGKNKKEECLHLFDRIYADGVHIYDKVNDEKKKNDEMMVNLDDAPLFG